MTALIRVGIVGLGRAGWGIHATTLSRLRDRFRVTAVADPDASRRAEAEDRFACASYGDALALAKADDADLVIVATPSHMRTELVIALLDNGKHVLVEKPFALSVADADAMFAAADRNGRIVTCSQNRRYSIDFLRLREVLATDALGSIVEVKISWQAFRRRWDWQTLRRCGGGTLNNDGSHVIDQALLLIGDAELDVHCRMVRTELTAGDGEDHVKIVLAPQHGPIVDIELSNACAFPQAQWLVLGTAGGVSVADGQLRWNVIDRPSLLPRSATADPPADRGYTHEELAWEEHFEELPAEEYTESHVRLYEHLHDVLAHGATLAIERCQLRRQLEVLDRCRAAGPIIFAP